jgi:hypothetical protein
MPFLAVALGPAFKGRNLAFIGFAATGLIVQSALSRAALVMFAGGTVVTMIMSLAEKPTGRRFGVMGFMAFGGIIGLTLTLDTITARFNDRGNNESSELREVLNEASREMQHDYPLGIGWNNYAHCINPPFRYAEIVYDWNRGRGMTVDESKPNAPVESHYYLLFAENGFPGLLSWLLLIGVALGFNALGFLTLPHSFERCLCLGLIAGCSLNYVQSTLERVLTQPRNLMLWLILLGVSSRLETMRRARSVGAPGAAVRGQPGAAGDTASTPSTPDRESPGQQGLPWPAASRYVDGQQMEDGTKPKSAWPTPGWAQRKL